MLKYPSIDPVFLKLGPLEFRWYGLAYILGLLLPFIIFKKEFVTRFGMNADDRSNLMLSLLFGILIGGRIGYVLIYDFADFIVSPLSLFFIHQGGMSYHGGAIGAMVGMISYGYITKRNILQLLDILGIFSTIGIGLGRLANFINGELYGRVTEASWGMVFPTGGPLPRHPSQLYEAFFEGLVLYFILHYLKKSSWLKDGQLFGCYVFLYGMFRFFIEFTRQPDPHLGLILGPFSMGQLLCLLWMLIGSLILILIQRRKTQVIKPIN